MKSDDKLENRNRPAHGPRPLFHREGNNPLERALLVLVALCSPPMAPPAHAENGWSNSYMVSIQPTFALPDYDKRIVAGDTPQRRFGNAFVEGDFNGDGRLDLAANIHGPDENNRSMAVRMYLQTSTGDFVEKGEQPLPSAVWTWAYAAGDLNGDGHLDILLDDFGNELFMLPGKGDGTFRDSVALGLGAAGLFALADMNADGHLDVVAGKVDGSVGVFLNNGRGVFEVKSTLDTYLTPFAPPNGDILIGDLNGDAKSDIAIASVPANSDPFLGTLDVFLANGGGTFQEAIRTEHIAARKGALGDFNGDGILDYAGDRSAPSQLEIWLGQGNGRFAKRRSYSLTYDSVWMVRAADLNSDGVADLLVSGAPLQPLNLFLGKGDGTFQLRESIRPASNYQFSVTCPKVVDINGDGLPDIVGVAENLTARPEEILMVALNTGLKPNPNRGFLLEVSGPLTSALILERTSDFLDWVAVATNSFAPGSVGRWPINDTLSGQKQGFYRARQP